MIARVVGRGTPPGEEEGTNCLSGGGLPPVSAVVALKWLKTTTFHRRAPRPIALLFQPE
ncbi:hypothetical protein VULLAG_LOCUS17664 [Vulpes lagopus]